MPEKPRIGVPTTRVNQLVTQRIQCARHRAKAFVEPAGYDPTHAIGRHHSARNDPAARVPRDGGVEHEGRAVTDEPRGGHEIARREGDQFVVHLMPYGTTRGRRCAINASISAISRGTRLILSSPLSVMK